MRLSHLAVFSLVLGVAPPALADSHPKGVTYPLTPAVLQPSGLTHPLPSTRRYVLVWKDQLADAVQSISQAQKQFIVTHYVGTQKVFKKQIDEYRQMNPDFLVLVYHLAYGLNGADQQNPVGNIVGPDTYGQEDTDVFSPYVTAHSLTRENAYQHGTSTGFTSDRIFYPDPYWLMDITSAEWKQYMADTMTTWAKTFATTESTGFFFDVAFHPWYGYQPSGWWSPLAGGSSHGALAAWWNPRATQYFDDLRKAFAPTKTHGRYLVIPNPDSLIDEEPAFLDGTDGAFTENWQAVTANAGDWYTSVRRISRYVTGNAKTWIADVTKAGTDLTMAERELLIGTYLLVRNGTSYIMFGNSDITWYPEYEIDLGGYVAEPPADVEQLLVAGKGGAQGGLYERDYVAGMVLVNSSGAALTATVPRAMKQAEWTGGGAVDAAGTMPAYALTYTKDVPAGSLSVPARSAVILQDPAALPPPGVEPGGGGDGGVGADGGLTPGDEAGLTDDGGAGGGGEGSGGCGCVTAGMPGRGGGALLLATAAVGAALIRRRAARGCGASRHG